MGFDIAIVGGGIGGLYAAYRLREAWLSQRTDVANAFGTRETTLNVHIFERNPFVLGGRIRTAELPFRTGEEPRTEGKPPVPSASVSAELGAMRITTRHLLARRLFDELGVRTVPFEGDDFSEHYFLRGKHFSAAAIKQNDRTKFPYALDPDEVGKTPGALVERVLEQTLKELSLDRDATHRTLLILEKLRSKAARGTLGYEEWCEIQRHGLLTGRVHLKNIGMWNLISHYLSAEAASFVDAGFGYESIIGNWNVSDAIPWFIADFDPAQRYDAVFGSFIEVVRRLEAKLKESIANFTFRVVQNAQIVALTKRRSGRYLLKVKAWEAAYATQVKRLTADAVILAMPRRSLEELHIDSAISRDNKETWEMDLVSVRPHRLVKIAQAYRKAWWRRGDDAKVTVSRTFTDLPLRQVYYYSREWLEERGRYRNKEGGLLSPGPKEAEGLIVAYLDGHYASFWRFITAVLRVQRGATLQQREEQKREWFGDRTWGWREPEIPGLVEPPATEWDRALHLYFYRHGLYERAAAKMRHLLEELHKPSPGYAGIADIPQPIAGAYTFWDDHSDDSLSGAGWHTWEAGVDSDEVMKRMTCPFSEERIYVCGEAYSNEQGWIEGALKSVERFMDHLELRLPEVPLGENPSQWEIERASRMRDHIGVPAKKHAPVAANLSPARSTRIDQDTELVFLAGKIGFTPPAPRPSSFALEAGAALDALLAELNPNSDASANLLSVRVFLTSMDDYDEFNEIYNKRFEAAGRIPTRTAVAVAALPANARVEVDGVAEVKRRSS